MKPPRVGPSSTPRPDMMPVAANAAPRLASGRTDVIIAQALRRQQRGAQSLDRPEGDQLARASGTGRRRGWRAVKSVIGRS